MMHRKAGRALGRKSSHRTAMYRNMAASLFTHEVIRTTLPKAKELRRVAEPLITLSKQDSVAHRRLAFDRLREALQGFLLVNLFPAAISNTVIEHLNQFAAKANELSLIGTVAFLLTAFVALVTIERAGILEHSVIQLDGNSQTLDYVIRRELNLVEGDAYNRALVDRSKNNIRALGFFKDVNIEEIPGSAPDRTTLQVKVEEQPTGELSFSASNGNLSSVSLVSCSTSTSGCCTANQSSSCGNRTDRELTFQVASFIKEIKHL